MDIKSKIKDPANSMDYIAGNHYGIFANILRNSRYCRTTRNYSISKSCFEQRYHNKESIFKFLVSVLNVWLSYNYSGPMKIITRYQPDITGNSKYIRSLREISNNIYYQDIKEISRK